MRIKQLTHRNVYYTPNIVKKNQIIFCLLPYHLMVKSMMVKTNCTGLVVSLKNQFLKISQEYVAVMQCVSKTLMTGSPLDSAYEVIT